MASRSVTKTDLDRLFRAAVTAAGPRYTVDANVDVPINQAFEALQRAAPFFKRFAELADQIERSRAYLLEEAAHFRQVAGAAPRLRGLALRCGRIARTLRTIPRDPVVELPLRTLSGSARRLEADAEAIVNELYGQRELREGEAGKEHSKLLERIATRTSSIRSAAAEIASFSSGPYARVSNRGALLLIGEAGQGKTHLFCDVVRRALADGQPAILLMGQHFRSTGDVWSQIGNQVGISGLGGRGVLSALEHLGRRLRCRILLMIDALNEGGGIGLWPQALEEFIRAARSHGHVVVALSCRSSYIRAVIPRSIERSLTRFEHHGFASVEANAAARFFSHYGLRHPTIPLLSPEFSRPLFLKLFCEGLQGRRSKTAPSGHSGMTDVLENFARNVGRRIVRDMGHRELTMLPWQCLKALASRMAELSRESLDRSEAEVVVRTQVQGKLDGSRLFQKMLDEGLLSEDLDNQHGKLAAIIRFPYQQFSDHLIARYLLRHHLDRQNPASAFKTGGALEGLVADQFAVWRYSGILRALAIQIPEWTSAEFLELVPTRVHEELYRAHIQSIVWRRPDRFPDVQRAVQLLNDAARSSRSLFDETWDALLTVAAIPSHPLNARRLHTSLVARSLPIRDQGWSVYLHRSWEPGSVVDRYLEWSDSVDATSLPDDTLFLAAVTLTWFFTSSNRFIRDRSTKALVRILRGRFMVLSSLLDLFHGVNDPYVTERLLCSAYGCALLNAEAVPVAALAQKVHRDYLTGSQRQRHILARDYAEGIVARAKALRPSLRFRTVKTRWQGVQLRPPTRRGLGAKYGDDRYLNITRSVMGQGDFDRYVIEPALRSFTGYRLSERIPRREREENQGASVSIQLWLSRLDTEPTGSHKTPGSSRQATRRQVARRDPKERFDFDIARRWIFARVLSLGWTPNRFYDFDRMVNYRDMREARKPERVGKKYQWIAFHELLGMLADNYRWHAEFDYEQSGLCPGGWAMGIRDIDPSHLPWSRPKSGDRPWWQPLRYELRRLDHANFEAWIRNRYWPDPRPLILSTDPNGTEWLVTEGHYQWRDADAGRTDDNRYPYREVWYQLRCYLVRKPQADRMRDWISEQDFMGRWMPESVTHHGEFVGEYPWHPSARPARQGWTHGRTSSSPVSVLVPATRLSWDDSFDASTHDSYSGIVPAAWLVQELQASWQPPFDYITESGGLVGLDPSWHGPGEQVGLVRRREFEQLCRKLGMIPFWTLLGEKRVIEDFGRPIHPWREVSGSFEIHGNRAVGSLHQKLQFPGA